MARMPHLKDSSKKELDKVEEQFHEFDTNVKKMTLDRMNEAPKEEVEPQTKIAQRDIEKSKDIYLKPIRTVYPTVKEKFNEKFRSQYEFDKQYVHFTAESKELSGEDIDLWSRPYGGMPAEEWRVPTNKPVWAPRYVAEQIKRCNYHRLVLKDHVVTEANSIGQMYGALAVDTTVQRLDAHPVSTRKSIFMGANNF